MEKDNFNPSSEAQDSGQLATKISVSDITAKLVKKCRVNLNCDPQDPPFTAYMNGAGILPYGDLFAIKAKAKQGKTQAATVLMSGLLGSEKLGIRAAAGRKPKVVYFDTEQAEANTIIVGHRVHQLVGWEPKGNHPEFRCYNIRTEDLQNKWNIIEHVIIHFEPTCVIIDGIADLVADFNDNKESQDCILRLMQLSNRYQTAIGCVLHENKGKEDNNMRGHLGTHLINKASETFEVTNRDGTFRLNHETPRNKPAGYIEWRIDQGMLVRSDKPQNVVAKEMQEEHMKMWQKVFIEADEASVAHNKLARAYSKEFGVSIATANRKIKEAVVRGWIVKNEETGLYELEKA